MSCRSSRPVQRAARRQVSTDEPKKQVVKVALQDAIHHEEPQIRWEVETPENISNQSSRMRTAVPGPRSVALKKELNTMQEMSSVTFFAD